MDRDDARSALDIAVKALGLRLDDACAGRLLRYAEELARWNRRLNLTGAGTAREFVAGPLFDAMTLVPVLGDPAELVDVGSGGGLPGIPAAILRPELAVTLVEPRARRAAFLRHAVHLLGLRAEVVQGRAGELADGGWSAAVAQAVWPPAEWLVRAPRLVRPGGAVHVLSSSPLSSADIPPALVLEQAFHCRRPDDGKERFAFRLRLR
ncbi:MAG TPA: 16S rRNA (guanine(527)-N(7))-methyltransferase RsmG [Polyangia bacterium]|nr:16S rRNA (guanine(527)-N(7))-methyltransferase RsmG [Polyangia bacterium]